MPRIKKNALIRDEYIHEFYNTFSEEYYDHTLGFSYPLVTRSNRSHSSSYTTHSRAPALSKVDNLVTKLETVIQENNAEKLARLLRDDFIVEYNNLLYEPFFHTDSPRELQGHHYTYQVYTVQPAIEYLILKQNQTFRRLLALAKEVDLKNKNSRLHDTIVGQLYHLDLSDADLSKLDLSDANFNASQLTKTNLRKSLLENANFNAADLREAIITKEQLASCKIYVLARLPTDFWAYWDLDTKDKIVAGLWELKNYGETLQTKGTAGKLKGKEAIKLANKLLSAIHHSSAQYNEPFQKQFLEDLHSLDHLFDQHRSYARIIANITLCILSGIVGYLIAGAIHKKLTGHFTFFAHTHTHDLIKKIDLSFAHEPSAMATFVLGTHPRLGKKSAILPFFSHNKADAIGDTNVLPIIQNFLY